MVSKDIINKQLWWKGVRYLSEKVEYWPEIPQVHCKSTSERNQNKSYFSMREKIQTNFKLHFSCFDPRAYSSFRRLKRVRFGVKLFVDNCYCREIMNWSRVFY